MTPTTLYTMLTIAISSLCVSCSGNESTGSEDDISEADSAVYYLGRDHAAVMLRECRTTDDIRDRLLDIRARETDFRTRISESAARAYIYGFTSSIKESGDTLADTLF